jgi:hypothetical protein
LGHQARPWEGLQVPVTDEDRAIFNAATVVQLGNGKKASFWNSRWLNGETLAARFPMLHKHFKWNIIRHQGQMVSLQSFIRCSRM